MSASTLWNRVLGTLGVDAVAEVNEGLRDIVFIAYKSAADAMAADESTLYSFKPPCDLEYVSLSVMPLGALTAHADNHAEVILEKRDGAGGAAAQIAHISSETVVGGGTGDWASGTYEEATDTTAANHRVLKDSEVRIHIGKEGSGVVVPICSVTATFRKI
jgi:hypothetical protein